MEGIPIVTSVSTVVGDVANGGVRSYIYEPTEQANSMLQCFPSSFYEPKTTLMYIYENVILYNCNTVL